MLQYPHYFVKPHYYPPTPSHNSTCSVPITSNTPGSGTFTARPLLPLLTPVPFFRSLLPRSPPILSNNTLAGSSFGSCGTSRPANASCRILWRNRSARLRFASTRSEERRVGRG